MTMNPERWRQIDELYHSARERGPSVLEGTDPDIRQEVERLLAQDSGGRILDSPAADLLEELFRPHNPSDPQMDLAGQTISHYEIRELLGAGGMGVVYKAFDTRLQRLVALKFLPPHLRHDEELKRRLTDEARAASALDHPNIVVIQRSMKPEIYSLPWHFMRASPCAREIAQGMPVREALQIARQIASGLAKAHENGILHRDIKPGNVIVAKDGIARIIDFGLARYSDVTATVDGITRGTPLYMSPEQVSGKALDSRTDLWSLGAVLFEMLAGNPPFRGDRQLQVMHSVSAR